MEDKLIQECKEIYNQLYKTLNGYEENQDKILLSDYIKSLFHIVNGKVHIKTHSETYTTYEGKVENYTIGGSISKNYLIADLKRLIEDLTMAYYRNHGGQEINYIPDLIKMLQ